MSTQVNRITRGPGPDYVWQVAPITHTLDFVAKLLEIHEKHAARQWQKFDMEDRIAASGSMDDAARDTPQSDMALAYDVAQEAWEELVDWMGQQQMLKDRKKSSRRVAAAAVCHAKVGDKRVAMWVLRFGSLRLAAEFLEQQRAAKASEPSQGSAEVAQARKKRCHLRLADATRLKIRLADCGSAYCPCGQWGPLFTCVHCFTRKCQEKCQHVIEKANESPQAKAGRYLVCKRCRDVDAKPLEWAVEASLPPHGRPRIARRTSLALAIAATRLCASAGSAIAGFAIAAPAAGLCACRARRRSSITPFSCEPLALACGRLCRPRCSGTCT